MRIKLTKFIFSIGWINIQIDTDTSETNSATFLNGFLIKNEKKRKVDVLLRLREVKTDSEKGRTFTLEEKKQLQKILLQNKIDWNNLILYVPIVKTHLIATFSHDFLNIIVDIQTDSVTIVDFNANIICIYYTQDISAIIARFVTEPRLFAQFLPSFFSALFHSAGIIIKNKTALFLAPDEGGKTTTTRILGGICIGDDQILIRRNGQDFLAHGTPWGIIKNSQNFSKVGGIFLIRKSNKFRLERLKNTDTFQYLWNEHLDYYSLLPKKLKIRHFNFLADFCKINSYIMHFPEDFIDRDAIERAMSC